MPDIVVILLIVLILIILARAEEDNENFKYIEMGDCVLGTPRDDDIARAIQSGWEHGDSLAKRVFPDDKKEYDYVLKRSCESYGTVYEIVASEKDSKRMA